MNPVRVNGGIVIYPTETVYGLGCDPRNPEATERVCSIKKRFDKPLPLACFDINAAKKIVKFSRLANVIAKKFWPGPLMLILPTKVKFPIGVTSGLNTLGVRVPDNEISRKIARYSGDIIVSTSANITGEKPPSTAIEAARQIGEEVDLILDGGPTQLKPSTVIDLKSDQVKILRKGPITRKQIMNAL